MSPLRRGANGSVCVLPEGGPPGELIVRLSTRDLSTTRDDAGAVWCCLPPSASDAAYSVMSGGTDRVTLSSGVIVGDAPVRRGAGGLTRCVPGGVACDLDGIRCRFPAGDAPDARRDADGGVVCRPAASSHACAFTVTAMLPADGGEVLLGDGVLAPAITGMSAFAAMTACYLLFTVTDGALRMVVLFHAFSLSFSAWDVAIIFAVYELAGIATNLCAGVAGARWGIRATLLVGLSIQLAGIALLFGFDITWSEPGSRWKALAWIAAANGVGGVAKDLVKLGGKTVSKLVTPEEKQTRLFAIVSGLTGAKNSLKGAGYFVGAASLSVSLPFALALNAALICIALPIAACGLARDVGRARSKNVSLATILSPAANVKKLSLARAFLFGARDVWFEVCLPFYLRSESSGLGWSRTLVGAALAGFIIVYGNIQAATPWALLRPLRQEPANKLVEVLWCSALSGVALILTLVFTTSDAAVSHDVPLLTIALCILLCAYCFVFAVNSSIHSYLIVRYADGDKVSSDIGFYYMSNAAGRFMGTLVGGSLYQFSAGDDKTAAMGWCFLASTAFSLAATLLTLRISDQQAGLSCGGWMIVAAGAEDAQSRRGAGGEEGSACVVP